MHPRKTRSKNNQFGNERITMKTILCLLAILLGAVTPGYACYSGLTVIPTVDTVGDKKYGIEFQIDGAFSGSEVDTNVINTQYGFTDRFEAGIDFDLSTDADPRILLNAKYVLAQSANQKQALAIGVCNAAGRFKSNPYAVGMQDLGIARLHAGIIRIDSRTRWFAGTDHSINDKVTLMADYTNGDENYSSVGVNYQAAENFGVMLGTQFPNQGSDERFTCHLVFSGP